MLHSVQHLFLSTESPSLPWVETKTQTRKKEVYKPTKQSHRERREEQEGGSWVVVPRLWLSRGFPFPSLPALSQPCPAWGQLQLPSSSTLLCTGSSTCPCVPGGVPGTSLSLPSLSLYSCSLPEELLQCAFVTQTQSLPCHPTLVLPPDAVF